MPVEYYKGKKGYYFRRGPRGSKRIPKSEYDEAIKGVPISRRKARSKPRKNKSRKRSSSRRKKKVRARR
jgi:hypothetical protein